MLTLRFRNQTMKLLGLPPVIHRLPRLRLARLIARCRQPLLRHCPALLCSRQASSQPLRLGPMPRSRLHRTLRRRPQLRPLFLLPRHKLRLPRAIQHRRRLTLRPQPPHLRPKSFGSRLRPRFVRHRLRQLGLQLGRPPRRRGKRLICMPRRTHQRLIKSPC